MSTKILQVGVIGGLGLMASPMAKHWKDKDDIKVLRVHDRGTLGLQKDQCRRVWQESGAVLVSTFEDLVGKDKLDGIFICAGKNGDDLPIIASIASSLAKASPGAFICHLSTVSSSFVKAAYEFCSSKHIHYVNYPLTGGPIGAENASMLILAGGDYVMYEKLAPVLSYIGRPKYFGSGITSGTEAKLMGHLMVFNGLIGICSAAAIYSTSFNNGIVGGEAQVAFLEFLNQGAGGTRQWEVALSSGLRDDIWHTGFPIKYAIIDAIYAIQMCMEYKVSWLVIQPIVNVALAFSYLMHKVDSNLATHAVVREMIGEHALLLNQFIMQYSAPVGKAKIALAKCIESLPENMREVVALNIYAKDFSNNLQLQ